MSSEGRKKQGISEIPYKTSASVDGAPKFASRWMMHFRYCAHGFCITVAGHLSISSQILPDRAPDPLAGPLQPYAFFATEWRISRISQNGWVK
jgi:hypothetical protein